MQSQSDFPFKRENTKLKSIKFNLALKDIQKFKRILRNSNLHQKPQGLERVLRLSII
jgi:hypothetical protein